MLTTDLALRVDPAYEKISRHFHEKSGRVCRGLRRAWYKLTHRDMGPLALHLGPLKPKEVLIWQDPIPAVDHPLVDQKDIAALKAKLLGSGLTVAQLATTAWAAASSFRGSDKRGGANGGRIRLAYRRRFGRSTSRRSSSKCFAKLEAIQQEFNAAQSGGKKGVAGRPDRARRLRRGRAGGEGPAGFDVTVPFTPGRADATQEQTDVESFAYLEPEADGFRNYSRRRQQLSPEELLVDRAQLLTLSAPELTVLIGGLARAQCRAAGPRVHPRRLHHAAGDPHQRLLRQPARHEDGVEALVGRGHLRRPGSRGPAPSSGPARGSTSSSGRIHSSGPCGGLCRRRREAQVRGRLRRGLDQGD